MKRPFMHSEQQLLDEQNFLHQRQERFHQRSENQRYQQQQQQHQLHHHLSNFNLYSTFQQYNHQYHQQNPIPFYLSDFTTKQLEITLQQIQEQLQLNLLQQAHIIKQQKFHQLDKSAEKDFHQQHESEKIVEIKRETATVVVVDELASNTVKCEIDEAIGENIGESIGENISEIDEIPTDTTRLDNNYNSSHTASATSNTNSTNQSPMTNDDLLMKSLDHEPIEENDDEFLPIQQQQTAQTDDEDNDGINRMNLKQQLQHHHHHHHQFHQNSQSRSIKSPLPSSHFHHFSNYSGRLLPTKPEDFKISTMQLQHQLSIQQQELIQQLQLVQRQYLMHQGMSMQQAQHQSLAAAAAFMKPTLQNYDLHSSPSSPPPPMTQNHFSSTTPQHQQQQSNTSSRSQQRPQSTSQRNTQQQLSPSSSGQTNLSDPDRQTVITPTTPTIAAEQIVPPPLPSTTSANRSPDADNSPLTSTITTIADLSTDISHNTNEYSPTSRHRHQNHPFAGHNQHSGRNYSMCSYATDTGESSTPILDSQHQQSHYNGKNENCSKYDGQIVGVGGGGGATTTTTAASSSNINGSNLGSLSQRSGDSLMSFGSHYDDTEKYYHPLYAHGMCRWPGCELVLDDISAFVKHLNTEHSLDDRSTAQARVQMQVVSQLEIHLQKERDRLQAMMHHLYLTKQFTIADKKDCNSGSKDSDMNLSGIGATGNGGAGTGPVGSIPPYILCSPNLNLGNSVMPVSIRSPILNNPNISSSIRKRISDKTPLSLAGGLPYMLERAGLDVQQEIQRNREFYKNADVRPPFTYASLIRQSIIESPDKQLTLNEIYNWFQNTFCYFRRNAATWKNAIRTNLSLHKCFVRYEDDFGSFWMVDDNEFVKRRHLSRGRPRKYDPSTSPSTQVTTASTTAAPTTTPLQQHATTTGNSCDGGNVVNVISRPENLSCISIGPPPSSSVSLSLISGCPNDSPVANSAATAAPHDNSGGGGGGLHSRAAINTTAKIENGNTGNRGCDDISGDNGNSGAINTADVGGNGNGSQFLSCTFQTHNITHGPMSNSPTYGSDNFSPNLQNIWSCPPVSLEEAALTTNGLFMRHHHVLHSQSAQHLTKQSLHHQQNSQHYLDAASYRMSNSSRIDRSLVNPMDNDMRILSTSCLAAAAATMPTSPPYIIQHCSALRENFEKSRSRTQTDLPLDHHQRNVNDATNSNNNIRNNNNNNNIAPDAKSTSPEDLSIATPLTTTSIEN